MKVSWLKASAREVVADWLVVGANESDEWQTPAAASVDEATGGLLTRLHRAGDFAGKSAELLPLAGIPGVRAERVLVVGLGKPAAIGLGPLHAAAQAASKHISKKKRARVAFALSGNDGTDAARRIS